MSCYVLSTPDGDVYACSDHCAAAVFDILTKTGTSAITVQWSREDRDVFCAGCATPLGWRRASALILHREMTPILAQLYAHIHERWWHDVAAH